MAVTKSDNPSIDLTSLITQYLYGVGGGHGGCGAHGWQLEAALLAVL